MDKLKEWWEDFFQSNRKSDDWWSRKKVLCNERGVEISRIRGNGHVFQELRYDNKSTFQYLLHLSLLMKQKGQFYKDEQVIPYQFQMRNGEITDHIQTVQQTQETEKNALFPSDEQQNFREYRFTYDRLAAVKYAELWWNSYNPAYRSFDVDCTNYVSQCLRAGGAPMWGAPNRGRGWWYQNENWSYSWAVAHSLRWYLSGSTQGLQGKEMQSANELIPGDVICYDFQGDGRWDHNTIVVANDANGMPLVNAHTDNSRNRYWSYEDSTAWTPNIQYKFFRIGE